MFCPHCGTVVQDGSTICSACQKEIIIQQQNTDIHQQPIQSELPAIDPGKKFATIAFISGISIFPASIILEGLLVIIGIPTEHIRNIIWLDPFLSIISLIFAIIYLKKGNGMNRDKAIAGMICSIVFLSLCIFGGLFFWWFLNQLSKL